MQELARKAAPLVQETFYFVVALSPYIYDEIKGGSLRVNR